MKIALSILGGMLLMYIILKVMSAKEVSGGSESWDKIKALIKTQQFNNLIKTNEFREIVKTSEFRSLITTLANDQIVEISKTLIG
jgi:hypothetical protein